MALLKNINGPADLRGLSRRDLKHLAQEIREDLTRHVLSNGGHLGSNLGVVELTLALHRVFESPSDVIVWDTGHQAYVHKMVTGRALDMARLRRRNGLSGYPDRGESRHDVVANSHASTALAYADGLAIAAAHLGRRNCAIVAVVGDGALTGGMSWEGLNNLAQRRDVSVVIVVNDNGRSYDPTVGGIAAALARAAGQSSCDIGCDHRSGNPVASAFELGYIGPVDGHDLGELEDALRAARQLNRPAIVHCLTHKGKGYDPAEADPADRVHAVAADGRRTIRKTWTDVFGETLVELARENPDVVAVTAAMRLPVGFRQISEIFPDRVIDVGIAEQHAVASAAGMAAGGLHPIVAIHSAFTNRAFDQMLMDVALHGAAVTLVADRAGVTGEDGPSHNGVWDLSLFQVVPGIKIAAPRDEPTLRKQLREAVGTQGPTLVRFPKGGVPSPLLSQYEFRGLDLLVSSPFKDILIVSVGAMAHTCVEVADALREKGIGVTVVDPGWVAPVNPAIAELARDFTLTVTVEDGVCVGGIGAEVRAALDRGGVRCGFRSFGIPRVYLKQGSRSEVLGEAGLDPVSLSDAIWCAWSQLESPAALASIMHNGSTVGALPAAAGQGVGT